MGLDRNTTSAETRESPQDREIRNAETSAEAGRSWLSGWGDLNSAVSGGHDVEMFNPGEVEALHVTSDGIRDAIDVAVSDLVTALGVPEVQSPRRSERRMTAVGHPT